MLAAFKLEFNFLFNIRIKNATDNGSRRQTKPIELSEYKIKIIRIH